MVEGQNVYPWGEEQIHLLHGELVENRPNDFAHRTLVQRQAVSGETGYIIPLRDVRLEGLGPFAVRLGGIE